MTLDPFDDAIQRMRTATCAAQDAFLDANAALTVNLRAAKR